MQEQIFASFSEVGPPTVSAAVSGWVPAKGDAERAARAEACRCFRTLHGAGAFGAVETHASPRDIFSLVRAHATPNMNQNVLKVGPPPSTVAHHGFEPRGRLNCSAGVTGHGSGRAAACPLPLRCA